MKKSKSRLIRFIATFMFVIIYVGVFAATILIVEAFHNDFYTYGWSFIGGIILGRTAIRLVRTYRETA